MDGGEDLMALVYRKAFHKGRGNIGFCIECQKVWNGAETPERHRRRYAKAEDPERMSMRSLRAALCEFAGKKGRNCEKCALCGFGRAWTRRSRDDT